MKIYPVIKYTPWRRIRYFTK